MNSGSQYFLVGACYHEEITYVQVEDNEELNTVLAVWMNNLTSKVGVLILSPQDYLFSKTIKGYK